MSSLEQLLASLGPERVAEQTARRADEALNSFTFGAAVIEDWVGFTERVAEFFTHVEAKMLRMGQPVYPDPSFHWPRCVQILRGIYGPSGEKVAFEKARTGNEGGLYAVLKALALTMGEHYAEDEIKARIADYWDRLTVDEQLAAVDEYLERYGHLLPSEMTEGTAARVRANFPRVLAMHPSILQRTRRVGR